MKKKQKTYKRHNISKNNKAIIEKRYNILSILIILFLFFLFIQLFYIQIVKQEYYTQKVMDSKVTTYEGSTAARGRIYDRFGRLLVDNEPVKTIYYKKSNLSTEEEIELSYQVSSKLQLDYEKVTERMIRDFWVLKYPDKAREKITQEEWQALEERRMKTSQIESLKRQRVLEEELAALTEEDKKACYLYNLMNKGYSYSEKMIKASEVSDVEYAYIASNVGSLKGFNVRLTWNRAYPYGNIFKSILGNVSTYDTGIPADMKEEYLNKGYTLDDRVGISYLEYEYDDVLKGKKDVYQKTNEGDILIEEGNRGNDLYLTIDIELQKKIEEILEDELKKTKKEANTDYYNHSFVIVTDTKTGGILAMAGKMIVEGKDGYEIYDYTPGVFTSSLTVGSVIKGASHIVGYNTGALKIGERRSDTCVKLAATPQKCSWKPLGSLNDLTALKYSSNTYQFYTAMKVAKYRYVYNGSFKLGEDTFSTYRNTFKEFGLGSLTEIDLPNEKNGITGKNDTPGLLLDFSIGQYDTYTPLQLAQYITTIANNGERLKLHLMDKIVSSTSEETLQTYERQVLNTVTTEEQYMKRVQEGFKQVLEPGGTGYNYIKAKYKPAGKTGTSQSFLDSDEDGKVDKETLTHTFAAYAPYDNPEVSFVIASPNVFYQKGRSEYTTAVNRRLTQRVSDAYFETVNQEET